MILEEIDGDVKLSLRGQPVSVGSTIADHDYALVSIVGNGKATFRVDPSCTIELKATKVAAYEADEGALTETQVAQVVASAPAPQEIQITAESTVNAVETAVKVGSKTSTAK
jgi:hypothetical protein